jgi:hypothetical protein
MTRIDTPRDRAALATKAGDPDGGDAPGVVAGAYFDPARGPGLGTTIVRAVAEADGVAPEALGGPPLYDRIDAEHLEKALFNSRASGSRGVTVAFSYRGYRVQVHGDGYVRVVDAAEA